METCKVFPVMPLGINRMQEIPQEDLQVLEVILEDSFYVVDLLAVKLEDLFQVQEDLCQHLRQD